MAIYLVNLWLRLRPAENARLIVSAPDRAMAVDAAVQTCRRLRPEIPAQAIRLKNAKELRHGMPLP
jgi:hypothetical protein